MPKYVRIVGSFLVVVATYCVYSLLVVPFIEPEDTAGAVETVTEEERKEALANVINQRADLRHWFKEGDWELTTPKILETAQGKLLLKEYVPDEKDPHEMELKPCTMIFMPEGNFENEEERARRAIVLRSPDGARLRFAEPIDLKKGQVGSKIVGGVLLGKVTIQSGQRLPGPEDDLLLLTERVTLTNDVITTPHQVEFFQGPNQGRGRDMRLALTTEAEKEAHPSYAAIKSLELARDVYMRMESSEGDLFMDGDKQVPSGPAAPAADSDPNSKKPKPPVEITCQGRFHFDARGYVATFHDNVDVVRLNAIGPSDTLKCDKLALHFENDPTAAPPATPAAKPSGKSTPKLRPKLIVADGNPVILDSPSNGIDARGQRLEYDVQNRSGKLLDDKEAALRQNDPVSKQVREIHARELEFESDTTQPSGPPRRVDARGKGWLRGSPPDNPGQQIFVSWTSRLTFYPFEGNQVLSIRGNAHVQSADAGGLDADEIHVWLEKAVPGGPTLAAKGKSDGGFVPQKMTAIGHVRPDTPQLQGLIGQLSVWFEKEPPPVVTAAPTTAAAAPPPPEPEKPAERAPPNQRWHVSGDMVKAQALLRIGGKTDVTQMTLDGHARCAELPMPVKPDRPLPEKPEQLMEITGEQLHLVQPTPQETTVRITGRPGRVIARGMTLEGGSEKQPGSIYLHRASNHLWVPGPGVLILPVAEDMQGRKLAQPQLLRVNWQGRMDFDGTVAHFLKSEKSKLDVVARTDESVLKTPDMQVIFQEPVHFDGGHGSGARPQVDRLICRRGVDMDHHEFQLGKQTSWERMKARDLVYEYRTGDLMADGPGTVTRTWLDDGSSSPSMLSGPTAKKKGQPAKPANSGPRMLYLHSTFDDKLTGNQHRELVTLHHRVKSVYGPVLNWMSTIDPNHPERFGTEAFVVECEKLDVAKVGQTRQGQPAMVLSGEGNTLIIGSDFSARCRNLHYESSKDQLVLSGDGRAPATFYRNQQLGSNPLDFSASRILYYPKTQKLNVDKFQSLDVKDLQSQKPSKKPGTR